ncbi:MAG: Bax inhibitor-1/YccA family protein [Prevotella sp.]|nr:Bax inhibitor-1/YccA family protein [Prevotella sp.]
MNERELNRMIDEREGVLSLAFPSLMRKVYLWMTLALAVTGFTAYAVTNSFAFWNFIAEHSWLMFAFIIAELGLVFTISGRINKLSLNTATLLFGLYSVLNGLTLAPILMIYTHTSIAQVFFITAGTFAAMAFIGYTTKANLSSLGRILFMLLIGLIIATVVNIFIKSSGLDLILSYAGVLIFVGLTAYDTQKIKMMLAQADAPDENAHKIALLGSLSLYLDFVNLFIYLLRLFGNRE